MGVTPSVAAPGDTIPIATPLTESESDVASA